MDVYWEQRRKRGYAGGLRASLGISNGVAHFSAWITPLFLGAWFSRSLDLRNLFARVIPFCHMFLVGLPIFVTL